MEDSIARLVKCNEELGKSVLGNSGGRLKYNPLPLPLFIILRTAGTQSTSSTHKISYSAAAVNCFLDRQ